MMKKWYKYISALFILIIMLYITYRVSVFRDIISLIFISFVISYSLKPLQMKLINKGMSNKTSALIIILGFVALLTLIFSLIIPSIIRESKNLSATINEIENYILNFEHRFKKLKNNEIVDKIVQELTIRGNKTTENLTRKIFDWLLSIGEDFIYLLVIPIIVYYFLSDRDTITNRILVLLPARSRNMVRKILKDIDKVLSRYVISQFFLCGLIGIITFIILLVYRIQFPITLSIINAVFNIIPYFGPILGAVPVIAMAILKSPQDAIWIFIWLWILQQIEGNIISPKITGDSVNMHPLLVIVLLIIGGKLGGFVGMVLAVPAGVIIKVIYEDLNYYLFS